MTTTTARAPTPSADARAHSEARPERDPRKSPARLIKFNNNAFPGFYPLVKARVRRHLEDTGQTRYADWTIALKGALFAALAFAAYGVVLSGAVPPWALLVFGLLFGCFALLVAINVAHDAAHHALTPNRSLNTLIQTLAFTMLGANAYLWQLRHVKSHHTFPNVNGCDVDIDSNAFLRLSPNHPRRWYHRYQHLYAPFIFWLVDIHAVFYNDFVYLFKKRLANMVDITHRPRDYVVFALSKLAYVALVFVLPLITLDLPWWMVLSGSLVMSFGVSLMFVLLLIGTHFALETEFPEFDEEGRLDNNWAVHALVTSLDWSPESRLACFLMGGTNAHAAHHLFPGVSHRHYVAITRIIRETAAEFGIPYKRTTLPRMIRSHFRFLRRMGEVPGPAKGPADPLLAPAAA